MSCRRYAANYDDDFFSSFFNRGTLKKDVTYVCVSIAIKQRNQKRTLISRSKIAFKSGSKIPNSVIANAWLFKINESRK